MFSALGFPIPHTTFLLNIVPLSPLRGSNTASVVLKKQHTNPNLLFRRNYISFQSFTGKSYFESFFALQSCVYSIRLHHPPTHNSLHQRAKRSPHTDLWISYLIHLTALVVFLFHIYPPSLKSSYCHLCSFSLVWTRVARSFSRCVWSTTCMLREQIEPFLHRRPLQTYFPAEITSVSVSHDILNKWFI